MGSSSQIAVLILAALASGDSPDRFVIPESSPLELSSQGPGHGDEATFSGTLSLTGTLEAKWLYVDDTPERLDVWITPTPEDLEKLPYTVEDKPQQLSVSNEEEVVIMLFGEQLGEELLNAKITEAKGSAKFTFTDYSTQIECDRRYYWVRVLSVEKEERGDIVLIPRVGC